MPKKTTRKNRTNETPKQDFLVVLCGASEQRVANYGGLTVGEIRRNYKDLCSIPTNAEAFIRGVKRSDNYVLIEDDKVLEFIRPSGQKAE